jgi:hypothetical protein
MLKKIGEEIYNVDQNVVTARGFQINTLSLNTALQGPIKSIIGDHHGKENIRQMLAEIANTGFENEILEEILEQPSNIPDWRIGEAIAEHFIAAQHSCEFPWPTERDLKNPGASPAGADLVGFQCIDGCDKSFRFAFGEVKTSQENRWPPGVSHKSGGLQDQIIALRDSSKVKNGLMLYMAHRANNAPWFPMFKSAMEKFLGSKGRDIAIFGILVRDVEPKEADLSKHAINSLKKKPIETLIAFNALYLPSGVISQLPQMLLQGAET